MATHDDAVFPVYVWELPVRIWHWVMAVAMVVLAVTGYLIGSPPPTLGGEASDHYLFGYLRFAHFAAAYVFAVFFALRVIWAFVGNKYSRELFVLPVAMLKGGWWRGMFGQMRYYLFLTREARPWAGHNHPPADCGEPLGLLEAAASRGTPWCHRWRGCDGGSRHCRAEKSCDGCHRRFRCRRSQLPGQCLERNHRQALAARANVRRK